MDKMCIRDSNGDIYLGDPDWILDRHKVEFVATVVDKILQRLGFAPIEYQTDKYELLTEKQVQDGE